MTRASRNEFWKIEAAGNDFILYFRKVPSASLRQVEVIERCRPHTGVGADGVVYTWRTGMRWEWAFFNADGSETALCGNAARALAKWMAECGGMKRSAALRWQGRLGEFRAQKSQSSRRKDYEVTWPLAKVESRLISDELRELLWQLNERGLAGTYLFDVGVPHLVLLGHEAWADADRLTCNLVFRTHPSLGRAGANVTWVELGSKKVVTFERGVERETLACGSGALAAFLSLRAYRAERGQDLREEKLEFPGGTLSLRVDETSAIWLGGPTRILFHGQFFR